MAGPTSVTEPAAVTVLSVPWSHPGAVTLRAEMAAEMTELYADRMGDEAVPAALHVPEDEIAYLGLAVRPAGTPVGHIALCRHGVDLELKRMFVTRPARRTGVATALLTAADRAAAELGAPRIVLQTGDRQPAAVRMYERAGYHRIPVFPPYDRLPFSICYAKAVTDEAVTTAVPDATTPRPC